MTSIAPETARRVFRGAEPIHGMIYFTPFRRGSICRTGFTHPRMGYFASRSAPMGAVAAEVTIATFFNFNPPELVHAVLPEAWTIATPPNRSSPLDSTLSTVRCARPGENMSTAPKFAKLPNSHVEPRNAPATDHKGDPCSVGTHHCRGLRSLISCCGMPNPCSGSFAEILMSHFFTPRDSTVSKRW